MTKIKLTRKINSANTEEGFSYLIRFTPSIDSSGITPTLARNMFPYRYCNLLLVLMDQVLHGYGNIKRYRIVNSNDLRDATNLLHWKLEAYYVEAFISDIEGGSKLDTYNLRRECISLLKALQNDDTDSALKVMESLVRDDTVTTHLNENIKVTVLPPHHVLDERLAYFNFYKSLNNTKGDVLVKPSKKNYRRRFLNGREIRYVDSVNIFLKEYEDVERFFEYIKNYSYLNEVSVLPFNKSYLNTTSDNLTVNKFDSDHISKIEEAFKESSLRLGVSKRKTPYSGNYIGYLGLDILSVGNVSQGDIPEVMSVVDDHRLSIIKSMENVKNSEMYDCNVGVGTRRTMTPMGLKWLKRATQSENKKVEYQIKNRGRLLEIPRLFYGEVRAENHHNALQYNNYLPPHGYDFYFFIPVSLDNIDHLLKLIQRQKLTGKIGNFKILSVTLAPYAGGCYSEIQMLIEKLSKL